MTENQPVRIQTQGVHHITFMGADRQTALVLNLSSTTRW